MPLIPVALPHSLSRDGVGQDGRGVGEQERAPGSRNSAGSEISGIDWLIVTIKMHSVVFDSAINL